MLLLWPHWLSFDWSMGCIPLIIQQVVDPRNLGSLFFWIVMCSALFKALFKALFNPSKKRLKRQ